MKGSDIPCEQCESTQLFGFDLAEAQTITGRRDQISPVDQCEYAFTEQGSLKKHKN